MPAFCDFTSVGQRAACPGPVPPTRGLPASASGLQCEALWEGARAPVGGLASRRASADDTQHVRGAGAVERTVCFRPLPSACPVWLEVRRGGTRWEVARVPPRTTAPAPDHNTPTGFPFETPCRSAARFVRTPAGPCTERHLHQAWLDAERCRASPLPECARLARPAPVDRTHRAWASRSFPAGSRGVARTPHPAPDPARSG